MIKVAINGYGRIGRLAHRVILEKYTKNIEVVAINAGSSTDIQGWMYLLKYDSVYGSIQSIDIKSLPAGRQAKYKNQIGSLSIDGKEIPVFEEKDPSLLPWKELDVDVVVESTGHLKTQEKLKGHLTAGAKKVILSAPAKDPSASFGSAQDKSSGQGIPTYVLSVNNQDYKGENLISNASCTTNCIAPVAKIVHEHFGIERAMMTTVHGYTSDQRLQDGGHKDYRRARAAALNIVPTTTGATSAAASAFPQLNNIFGGLAIRVPVPVGSLSDFTFLVKKNITKEEVNSVFKNAVKDKEYKDIVEVTEDPIVSSDIIGNSASAIIDLSLTQVVGKNMLKVIAWYDNEYGYANRLVEEVLMMGKV